MSVCFPFMAIRDGEVSQWSLVPWCRLERYLIHSLSWYAQSADVLSLRAALRHEADNLLVRSFQIHWCLLFIHLWCVVLSCSSQEDSFDTLYSLLMKHTTINRTIPIDSDLNIRTDKTNRTLVIYLMKVMDTTDVLCLFGILTNRRIDSSSAKDNEHFCCCCRNERIFDDFWTKSLRPDGANVNALKKSSSAQRGH
jgi:hypothetical protein